jgi:hypothetical protein
MGGYMYQLHEFVSKSVLPEILSPILVLVFILRLRWGQNGSKRTWDSQQSHSLATAFPMSRCGPPSASVVRYIMLFRVWTANPLLCLLPITRLLFCLAYEWPWRRRRYIPPKRQFTFNWLQNITSQKIEFFVITAVSTSNSTMYGSSLW